MFDKPTFYYYCIFAFLIHGLWLCEFLYRDGMSSYLYLTCWALNVQTFYYWSELLKEHVRFGAYIPTDIVQNIMWCVSAYIPMYWVFKLMFDWHTSTSIYFNLCIHGMNSISALITIYFQPRIEWKYIKYVYGFAGIYFLTAIAYTNIADESIYPTNFFSFKEIGVLIIMLFLIAILIPIYQYTGIYISKKVLSKRKIHAYNTVSEMGDFDPFENIDMARKLDITAAEELT